VHDQLGLHVAPATKNKIISGSYVDFAVLLESQPGEPAQGLNISSSGQLIIKPVQPSKSINSIADWTDAFLVYASIYLAAHPHRIQELLKYMNIIRTAARRHAGIGWKAYDQQIR
jgi:hypothetical protein